MSTKGEQDAVSSPAKSQMTGRAADKKQFEAANMAKRKKEEKQHLAVGRDNVAIDPKKLIKYLDWKQTQTDVTVTLLAAKKLSSNELDVVYTDSDVKVSLTDGRKWYCRFCSSISGAESKVQLQKMRIHLKIKKKYPGHTWLTLEHQSTVPVDHSRAAVLPSEASGQGKGESINTTASPSPASADAPRTSSSASKVPAGTDSSCEMLPSKDCSPVRIESVGHAECTYKSDAGNQGDKAELHDNTTVKKHVEPMEMSYTPSDENMVGQENGLTSDAQNGKQEMMKKQEKVKDPVYRLNHIKHDFYELGTSLDQMVVHIYVKAIDKDSLTVYFGHTELAVTFKTSDAKFLSMHPRTTEDTIFSWTVTVVDELLTHKCKHKVSSTMVELILTKVAGRKWAVLEASQTKSAQVPPHTANNWVPTNSSSSTTVNRAKVTPIKEAELPTSRVAFDEMSTAEADRSEADKEQLGTASTSSPQHSLQPDDGACSKDSTQKPTCMVSPLTKAKTDRSQLVAAGMTGLDNLGNTCFMNSVLQVLTNTRELRDYFLEGLFQKELNADNPLGFSGKLAVCFAVLMKILWSGKYRSYAPAKLKNLVGQKVSQYMGFAQHDAQEFMNFLLDGLHEDMNRIREKPYTEAVDSDGRPDEVVANEAWERHKKRNDSFIVDLFQGQYKSKLVCPVCSKVSITFDPFMHIPVPLPKKQRLMPVIFMSRNPNCKPVKYMLRLPKDATVDHLKEGLHHETGVHPKDLRVFEAYKNRIVNFFSKAASLTSVTTTDLLFACEVLSARVAGEPVLEIAVTQRTIIPVGIPARCSCCKRDTQPDMKLKRCTRCFRTAYCDHVCQKNDWVRHRTLCKFYNDLVGEPFIISLPESQATFSRLCQMVEGFSRYSVDVFQPPVSVQMNPTASLSECKESCHQSASPSSPYTPDTHSALAAAEHPNPSVVDAFSPDIMPQASSSSSTIIPSAASGLCTLEDSLGDMTSDLLDNKNVDNLSKPASEVQDLDSLSKKAPELQNQDNLRNNATELHMMDNLSNKASEIQNLDTLSQKSTASNGSTSSDSTFVTVSSQHSGYSDSTIDYASNMQESQVGNLSELSTPSSEAVSADEMDMEPKVLMDAPSSALDCPEPGCKYDDGLDDEKCGVTPPTRAVMGRQQDACERLTPSFSLKPCDKDGRSLAGAQGHKLEDRGEEPLDLSTIYYLNMDWKNADKCQPYVLVQTKDLDCEQDDTMHTAVLEENKDMSLDQCLSLFTEPEVLSPEEAWYCPDCKEHREASKQLSIWRLPPTLIIQIKRFSFRNFIWRDKIDKMVQFPLRALDLSKYYIGSGPSTEPPAIYDLYGVVNHYGGLLGGHYTAAARCPDTADWKRNEVDWRYFDDSMVSSTSESQACSRAAYILFYRRRHVVVALPATMTQQAEEEDGDLENLDSVQPVCDGDLYGSHPGDSVQPVCDGDLLYGSQPGDSVQPCTDDPAILDTYGPRSASSSLTDMDTVD